MVRFPKDRPEPLRGAWSGEGDTPNQHTVPRAAILHTLENIARACGWSSLEEMKKSLLRARGVR